MNMKMIMAIIHPYPPPSDFVFFVSLHVPMQQYSLFFVNVPSPSHVSSFLHTVPDISSHVSSDISKSSAVLPSGRMNRLSGIDRVFCSCC